MPKLVLDADEAVTYLQRPNVDLSNTVMVIQDVFSPSLCKSIRSFVQNFVTRYAPNEGQDNFEGNWYYLVDKEDQVKFYNCTFNSLSKLSDLNPLQLYQGMFQFHEKANRLNLKSLEDNALNCRFSPLVFYYPAGSGRFGWHLHDTTHQKYQVLSNVTRPGVDYRGGETLIRMRNGEIVELAADLTEGALAIFPYDLWHRVNTVERASADSLGRMTAILPYIPREGLKTFFDYGFSLTETRV